MSRVSLISIGPLVPPAKPYLPRNCSFQVTSENETEDAPFVFLVRSTKSQAMSRALNTRVVMHRWRERPHRCLPRTVKNHGSLTDSAIDFRNSANMVRQRSKSSHGSVGWVHCLHHVDYIDESTSSMVSCGCCRFPINCAHVKAPFFMQSSSLMFFIYELQI